MKVIDLLNKIANGEAPKKIKYRDTIWNWTGDDYIEEKGTKYLITGQSYVYVTKFLNSEIEIIEEPKKIEKLELKIYNAKDLLELQMIINKDVSDIKFVLNEIIDYINKGEE